MRRKTQQLGSERTMAILEAGSYGVLALSDGQGQYAVPTSYAVRADPGQGALSVYFHGATEGRKANAAKSGSEASFCVVGRSDVVPSELTVAYESAVVSGRLEVVLDAGEKERALVLLGEKYAPGRDSEARASIEALWERTMVFVLRAETASGKCGALLARGQGGDRA